MGRVLGKSVLWFLENISEDVRKGRKRGRVGKESSVSFSYDGNMGE